MATKTLESQIKATFNAAHKKALASGGGLDASLRALAQASEKAATMLAIELDRLRALETQPKPRG